MKYPSPFYEEYVLINGISQYFIHYPSKADWVLLFLHGGPGESSRLFQYIMRPADGAYTLVYYDQRGTGNTQQRNKTVPELITLETLLEDLDQTIAYLHDKYPGKPIVLFGHSWGTILGTVYLKAHPQQVAGYIGMGQVISMRQGEKIGYDRLGQLVTAKNNAKDLAVYTSFQGYPNYLTQDNFIKEIIRFRMFQRKYLQNDSTGIFKLILLMMKSPVFKLTDLRQSADPMETNKYLLASLLDYDITAGYDYAVPIFYICGRNDWQVPSVLAQKYFNLIQAPLKKLYWIEQAGHLTNIDNPAACAQAIEDILRNLTQLNL